MLAARARGALVAAFISHRRGIYYALLTIAFGQVFWFVAIKWHSVTGGEDGLLNIKRPAGDFGLVASTCRQRPLLLLLRRLRGRRRPLWRLVHSPFGRVLAAIRQNETRARFVGYNVWLYKWLAFTLSARSPGSPAACSRWRSSRPTRT